MLPEAIGYTGNANDECLISRELRVFQFRTVLPDIPGLLATRASQCENY